MQGSGCEGRYVPDTAMAARATQGSDSTARAGWGSEAEAELRAAAAQGYEVWRTLTLRLPPAPNP